MGAMGDGPGASAGPVAEGSPAGAGAARVAFGLAFEG
jgi:hypothetical protein